MVTIKHSVLFLALCTIAMGRIKIVTTTADLKSIAESIGGEDVSVYSCTAGIEDPRNIQPVPKFYWKLRTADMVVTAGLGIERSWLPKILETIPNTKVRENGPGYIDASDGIIFPEHAGDSRQFFSGTFYWLDPENGKIAAKNICKGLSNNDPMNAERYARRLAAFTAMMDSSIQQWQSRSKGLEQCRFITSEPGWKYFAERFHLNLSDTIPGGSNSVNPLHDASTTPHYRIVTAARRKERAGMEQFVPGSRIIPLAASVYGVEEVTSYAKLFEYNLDKLNQTVSSPR